METQEIICRLCLKVCDNFKAFEENMKYSLYTVLPKISLAAIQKPVMCTNCAEMLKKCFDFKVSYFNARNDKISSVKDKESLKLDLAEYVPLGRNGSSIDGSEEQDICEFCMSPKKCSTISFSTERGGITLETMIDHCFPEFDWTTIKRPIICPICCGSLEMCFHFISNCLIVEEKIKKCCERHNISSSDQVGLSSLLQPTISDVTMREVHGNSVGKIKIEKQLCEDREYADEREVIEGSGICKLEQMSYDDCGNIKEKLEYENESYPDITDQEFKNEEEYTPRNLLDYKEESNLDLIKVEENFCADLVEMDEQKFLPSEEIEVKSGGSDFYRLDDGTLPHQEVVTSLHGKQRSLVSDFGGIPKPDTKHTSTLKEHLLHKDPLEITVYKCDICSYQTKDNRYMKQHRIVHKDPSEITVYKCDSCSFQSRYKGALKVHLVKHRDPSEVIIYKCESCIFQTKSKRNIKRHLLVHKDPSEIIMHKCDSCSFETKYDFSLKKHLLVHKDPSQVMMYRCDSCSYETKHKRCLQKHLPKHEDLSEVTLYKCETCSYQTISKCSLNKHLLLHNVPAETKTYKCDSCPFQSINKRKLIRHLLVHKDSMYKCTSCSFETKYKFSLKKHLLVHKEPSEVTIYKCNSCSFQARSKRNLQRHLLVHKDSSEVIIQM